MDFVLLWHASLFSTFLVFCHLLIAWAKSSKSKRPAPPEPAGWWPIIGHLHLLGGPEPLSQTLGAMADKLGPTFILRLGMRPMLVVSSWEAVKDCFTTNDQALSTRPKTAAAEYMGYNRAMFGFAPYGPYWRELRKIATLELLSNAQLDSLKHVRATEIDTRVKKLYGLWLMNDRSAVPINLKQWCCDLTLNIVLRMVVGKRCFGANDHADGDDDSEERRFQKAISQFFYLLGVFVVSDVIPFLKWFDFRGCKRAMKDTAREFDSLLDKWLDEHRRKRSSGEGGGKEEDFMDVMLSITEDGQMNGYDRDTIIKATCMAVILGGTDTSSSTLAGAIAYVATNPHVMRKAQEELDIHVGKERNVEESDVKNLAYLQAIVKETLRHCPAVTATVPREAMEDCEIDGYRVRAGTRVMVNLEKLHKDPRVWTDPCEFRPERFLSGGGHANVEARGQHFEYIPFGSGRRSCPGISFAFLVMHLALARVIHGFDLAMGSDGPIDMARALTVEARDSSPLALRVLITPRLPSQLYE